MTRQRVQLAKQKATRKRGTEGESGSADRARGRTASRRAALVTQAARRFLARSAP
ncbi:hypothetical protein [Streptomyces sp. NRRL S-920]|uniref:hypothetical protein n=1 Tax=Streptomyces sp. NRRL S-920 TaxID=1463921 RepID=UPI000B126A33|nr:hypothetical protein [Streptomyces sp. NRRL S-920]